jgi:hypothetical protein
MKKLLVILFLIQLSTIYCQNNDIKKLILVDWNANRQDIKDYFTKNGANSAKIIENNNLITIKKLRNEDGDYLNYSYLFTNDKIALIKVYKDNIFTANESIAQCFKFYEYLYAFWGKPSIELCNIPVEVNYIWLTNDYKIAIRYEGFNAILIKGMESSETVFDSYVPAICITRNHK